MSQMPRDPALDSTLALLAEGYDFIPNRGRRLGSDAFETRLLLRTAVCLTGAAAAEVFYHPDRFTRRDALPKTAARLLQDFGSVQMLDGEAHRRRKQMFVSLMTTAGLQRLVDAMTARWLDRLPVWETRNRVALFPAAQGILCRAARDWAGVSVSEPEARRRTREFAAMIDGAGSAGPRNRWGQALRGRSERWARDLVERAGAGDLHAAPESPLVVVAWHTGLDGELLSTGTAAVELLNLLRPTVAVARFVAFAALALHDHPDCREAPRRGDEAELDLFVQEVRRFYPFFPMIGGRVLNPFEWRGRRFAKGTWVLLDLYGAGHDARVWVAPEAFRPDRFRRWDGGAFDFIPQGGDYHYAGRRRAGEWATVDLLKCAVRLLVGAMCYDVPEQDPRIDRSRMPPIPRSRFVIERVRRVPGFAA